MTDSPHFWPEDEEPAPGQTLVFPSGLPGFPNLRRFRLVVDPAFTTPPFELLASDDDPSIGFYLIDPKLIAPDYDPDLSEADEQELLIQPGDEIQLRAVVTVREDPTSTTANLVAPVALNLTTGIGLQSILEGTLYSLHTPLLARKATIELVNGAE